MSRKALYIHGLKVDKNNIMTIEDGDEYDRTVLDLSSYKKGASTVNVRELLSEHGYETISGNFNLLDVSGTLQNIRDIVCKEKISLIVASSLGGFYAIAFQSNTPVIALNPCLSASAEVKKMHSGVTQDVEKSWCEIERGFSGMKPVYKRCKYAIFAQQDELFHYKNDFDLIFGSDHSLLVPGPHQLSHYRAFLDEPVIKSLENMKRAKVIA